MLCKPGLFCNLTVDEEKGNLYNCAPTLTKNNETCSLKLGSPPCPYGTLCTPTEVTVDGHTVWDNKC